MKVKVYTTISGDTWDLISYKVYGSEKYFTNLIRANPALIGIAIFDSGISIIVPDIPLETYQSDTLPPWKR
ncbi:hypothetical protein IX317_000645 [Fusobacterium sp. DD29]|uniref:tail protein X n=1 Tax=unclassified Fusobacterium TaxID=2648384 RepID=UPI001DA294CC|nr:hypothetical protein [Fusobacterium sp. DD45]MBR8710512.1 hypothetical protein [Fusobacterium sp. DD28]MBR8748984.1 hypothetical protein [Fusobacterium sp. DD29]MBR8751038.1 hypothetical protein [Fusobacterium sp. DD26]MBR8761290.1 hypothetical protein [Fusobacterium sp. DD25]MBR8767218.1 hypothetical protein [Fusobacterium sp. DD43]MBR8771313.1 hypothetical protein [Fusobacterium sp. DD40]MBR8775494.1 hypothetical protein [Fusobacterium sp. DD17]MBR8797756.1 hypothetical protein [Fusoba